MQKLLLTAEAEKRDDCQKTPLIERVRQRAPKRHCLCRGDGTSRLSPRSERVADPLLIRHPPAGRIRLTRTRIVIGVAIAASLALGAAACQRPEEHTTPIAASAETQATIEEYLRKVQGRFGALAMSRDGSRAAYYICQSRLWKNCDNYELNDRFVSVPSARLAGREALSRCGGGCNILYLNGERQF